MKNKRQNPQKFFNCNFFRENRKAEIGEFLKTALWIIVFIILLLGVYFLIKSLGRI